MSRPLLAITTGDPAGIGPEVIIKCLASLGEKPYDCVVIGNAALMEKTARDLKLELSMNVAKTLDAIRFEANHMALLDSIEFEPENFEYGKPQANCGQFAYDVILAALDLAQAGKVQALVTGPICKEALHKAGHPYDGHTGLLAQKTGCELYRMTFATKKLKIVHCTAHLALKDAIAAITTPRVFDSILLGHHHLQRLGIEKPRVAVCGLNPHASEMGIFGSEDLSIIAPAVQQACQMGIDATGPLPADSAFVQAFAGRYDVIVAQYHDQGHIPGKLVAFDEDVNVTIGLPVIRTSVDHGTAFDIAGTGQARHVNLIAALDYAHTMVINS